MFGSFFKSSPKPFSHEARLKKVGGGIMLGGGAMRAWEGWTGKGDEGKGGGGGWGIKCIVGLGCPIAMDPGELVRGCGGEG